MLKSAKSLPILTLGVALCPHLSEQWPYSPLYDSVLAAPENYRVQWELIEPLDDEGIYARFLAEKGGGVHHIAVAAQSFDEMLAMEAKRGIDVVLSGEFEGVRVAYLDTDRDLGVILEIFSGLPNLEQKPNAT